MDSLVPRPWPLPIVGGGAKVWGHTTEFHMKRVHLDNSVFKWKQIIHLMRNENDGQLHNSKWVGSYDPL